MENNNHIQYIPVPVEDDQIHQTKSDQNELAKFGYKQQLYRTLSLFSTFGLAFSYISPVVGVYTLFGTGLSIGGPQFIWSLFVVVFGQMMVVLVFSEISIVYPLAGAIYQWASRLVGPRYGWIVGWIYIWALLITIGSFISFHFLTFKASIDLGASQYLIAACGISNPSAWMTFSAASGILVLHTVLNFVGVKVTSIVTNLGMITEVLMTLGIGALILIKPGPHQHPSILFSNETANGNADSWAFLTAMLSPAYIFFGFESAADVSEEIVDPKKSVPRAMILSLLGASIVSFFLYVALVIGIPDIKTAASNPSNTIPYILDAHLGSVFERILSALLIIAFVSCAGAVQAASARLLFAFGRDDMLPFSNLLKQVSSRTKTPTYATIVAAIVPLLVNLTNFINFGSTNAMTVVTGYCVVGIYLAFQSIIIGRIYAGIKGTFVPNRDGSHFHLGPLSLPIAFIALIYGVIMIVNIVIPPPPYNTVTKTYAMWTNYINLIMTSLMMISGILLSFLFVKK